MGMMSRFVVAAIWWFLAAAAAEDNGGGGFCRNYKARGCIEVETVRELDLALYSGRWFEIGSTAAFKLLTEAGLRCNQALYTLSPHDRRSLLLTNSGQRAVSPSASANIAAINLASATACSALRRLCPASAAIASDINTIQQINGRISQAAAFPSLASAVSRMQSAARDATSRLSGIRSKSPAAADAAAASLAAISAAANALLLTGQALPGAGGKVSSVNGTIRATGVSGKLEVTINGVVAPYWVVDLVVGGGGRRASYEAALVYSCSGGGLAESLFILSRRPVLEGGIRERFLGKARSLGLLRGEDCADPFLATLQLGSACGKP